MYYPVTGYQEWANDNMEDITGNLDQHLDGFADQLIDGVNQFNVSYTLLLL